MTGYAITIAGGKGGVGKTTTAINVGVSLQETGYDIAVVDADLGMANLGAMLDVEHEPSLHRVLAGETSVSDALVDGPAGITLVPGQRELEAFAEADPGQLRKVVNALSTAYDLVVIDTGAGLSHETTVPLGLADAVVMVTTENEIAVGDTVKTAELADRVDGEVIGAVLTKATEDTEISEVSDRLGMEMLAVVPEDPDATETEPLVITAPDSPAADAYRGLAQTLAGRYHADLGDEAVTPDPGTASVAGAGSGSDADAAGAQADDDTVPGEEAIEESSEQEDEGESEDDEDDGVFGLFN